MQEHEVRSDAESADIFSIEGPFQMHGRRKAFLSANVVIAYLERFDVMQVPAKPTKRFSWLQTVVTDEDVAALSGVGMDASILYICTEDRAPDLLDISPSAFLLVVSRTGVKPQWAHRNRNRIVLVASNSRLIYISSIMQNLFMNIVVWESALDSVVSAHGTLTELLNEGARAMGCFMAVTDDGFNDLAHTEDIEPPTRAFEHLVETGCYSSDIIAHIEGDVLPNCRGARGPMIDPRRYDGEPDLIHYPLFFNGDYFFHLVMACRPGLNPHAARDLLALFAERFSSLCAGFWEDIIRVRSPWHRVLTNLIDGVPMHENYLATQLSLTAIPESNRFCLLCFDLNADNSPTIRSHVTEAAAALNGGACYPFAYNGRLLVLCYSTSDSDEPFSLRGFANDIENHIPLTGKLRTGISKTFTDIGHIHIAFTQALLAINFSPCVDAECILSGRAREHYCYSFESIFPYYLLVTSMHDNELTARSISHGIIEQLAREDRESGTEIVQLLWTYLCLERNATAASKQLHMHRNTVLYHVEKIERRFCIEFDDLIMRTNLLDEFRVYFLTEGYTCPIDYEKFAIIRRYQERPLL